MNQPAQPAANKKLRTEREHRCWSQQELADKVGTTPLNVSRWERGITIPGPYFRQKLCEIFEKTAQELGLVPIETEESRGAEPLSKASEALTAPPSSIDETSAALWNVPYHRNLFFTGREDILCQLREMLTSHEKPVALTQSLAISGLGGIGKTQTAVEYAYRYRDSYDAVFWVRADSYDLLVSDFLLVAALLNLPLHKEQDQNLIVQAVLRWLNSQENWLLILDNADDLETASEFIPSAGKGHVLLTTRSQSTGTVAQRIDIEKMGPSEGTVLLLRRTKRLKGNAPLETFPEAVRKQALAIVEAVDGLPLALDQAGAYIEETGCSFTDYLKFYKTHHKRLLRTRGHDASGHPEPVATTWALSFEKVEQANPAAAELLRLCAFLHPDEIPEAMIAEGASELGPVLQPVVEDELEFNEAIGELRKYSLVKRDPELKLLNMHRLVQVVIKDAMDKETQRDWAERAVRLLNRAFPEVKFAQWPICQRYLPHAQICADLIAQWKMTFLEEAAQLLSRMGNYLQERAQYQGAEPLFHQALAIHEKLLEPTHPMVAESIHCLAWLCLEQGKYQEAEILYQRAISIYQHGLEPNYPHIAASFNDLALLYWYQGKYELAEPLYQQALTIYEQALGPDSIDVIMINNNLARLHQAQGKYEQAEALHQYVLSCWERVLGPNHPNVAHTLNGLALLYYEQGKYESAEPIFLRGLALREQALGPEHPYVARSLNGLALLYTAQGKYEQAESLFGRALSIRERVLGHKHPDTATTLKDYAKLLHKLGRESEATAIEARAKAIYEKQG